MKMQTRRSNHRSAMICNHVHILKWNMLSNTHTHTHTYTHTHTSHAKHFFFKHTRHYNMCIMFPGIQTDLHIDRITNTHRQSIHISSTSSHNLAVYFLSICDTTAITIRDHHQHNRLMYIYTHLTQLHCQKRHNNEITQHPMTKPSDWKGTSPWKGPLFQGE